MTERIRDLQGPDVAGVRDSQGKCQGDWGDMDPLRLLTAVVVTPICSGGGKTHKVVRKGVILLYVNV